MDRSRTDPTESAGADAALLGVGWGGDGTRHTQTRRPWRAIGDPKMGDADLCDGRKVATRVDSSGLGIRAQDQERGTGF